MGYGGQDKRWVICEENLLQVAAALRRAKIICADFDSVIYSLEVGDFIFADLPYRPGKKELIKVSIIF